MLDLITNRTLADVLFFFEIHNKIVKNGWESLTEEEKKQWLCDSIELKAVDGLLLAADGVLKCRGEATKGAYNVSDINRVESHTAYLAEILNNYGYFIDVIVKKDWAMGEIVYLPDLNRIRSNIDALHAAFASLPDWRNILYNDTLDFEQANTLEWDLERLYLWIDRMAAVFRPCGTFYMGE